MKSFPLILSVTAAVLAIVGINALVVAASADLDADSDSEYEVFTVGDLTYRILPDYEDEVSLVSVDSKNWDESTSVVIPDTVVDKNGNEYAVTCIGDSTFAFEPMGKVTLGKNIVSIEMLNFYSCENLTSLVLNTSLNSVGNGFLSDCAQFSSAGLDLAGNPYFDLYEGILYQSNTLITCVDKLSGDVSIADTTSIISDWAFFGQVNITSVNMPNSVTSIGNHSFNGCTSLAHVMSSGVNDTLPTSLIYLGSSAFYGCESLNSCMMSDNLCMIGSLAFSGCSSLDFVSIPWEVSYIGEGAFSRCKNLQNINVDPDNEKYYATNGLLFEQQTKNVTAVLIQYPQGMVTGDTIDLSQYKFISIGQEAFTFTGESGSISGFKIILPSSLLEIQSYAFFHCTGLREIEIPGSVDYIQDLAFDKCSDLEKVTLNEGLRYLCFNCFDSCSKLSSIEFPSSITLIEREAFSRCTSLKNVILPDSNVHVESSVFQGCTSLESVTVVNKSTYFDSSALDLDLEDANTITVSVPKGYEIAEDVFGNTAYTIEVQGERPYPYENWIAIAFAVLLMVGILRFIRRV